MSPTAPTGETETAKRPDAGTRPGGGDSPSQPPPGLQRPWPSTERYRSLPAGRPQQGPRAATRRLQPKLCYPRRCPIRPPGLGAASGSARPASLRLLAGRGQRLIACPLLDAALELFQRCRCSASWMPNDPYHLANAAAPTANRRSPSGEGRTLAVSAATVTEHVRDSGHEPTVSPLSRVKNAHSGWAYESHGICVIPGPTRDRRTAARWCTLNERPHPRLLDASTFTCPVPLCSSRRTQGEPRRLNSPRRVSLASAAPACAPNLPGIAVSDNPEEARCQTYT